MRKSLRSILVTGGAGFMGSEFVRQAVKRGYKITVIDKLTYAADLDRLKEVKGKIKFYKADICDKVKIGGIFRKERPAVVVNLAAQTHVDRSIVNSTPFIETNIYGTKNLLDLSQKYDVVKFIHISSDEVYGEIRNGKFSENSALKPNSPYAASKAAADLLINAYVRTYELPAIIVRPSNNYGPWQYPEKLIPLSILKALHNEGIPVYAKGQNVREWLFVSDCTEAIIRILEKGTIGQTYNVGSGQERKNIDVVKKIIGALGKPDSLIKFVKDRPGHDFRYALNSQKIKKSLGWQASTRFEEGLKYTVRWCLNNKKWINKHSRKKLSIKF